MKGSLIITNTPFTTNIFCLLINKRTLILTSPEQVEGKPKKLFSIQKMTANNTKPDVFSFNKFSEVLDDKLKGVAKKRTTVLRAEIEE